MSVQLPHETQVACIAALHVEIGRTRDILASLKPAGAAERADQSAAAAVVRLAAPEGDPV